MIAHKAMIESASEPALTLLPKRKRPVLVWREPDVKAVQALERRIIELPIESALCWQGWQLGHREPWRYWNAALGRTLFPRRFYDLRFGRYGLVGIEHYQQEHPRSAARVRRGLAELLAGLGWTAAGCRVVACPDAWVYAAHRKPRLFKMFEKGE